MKRVSFSLAVIGMLCLIFQACSEIKVGNPDEYPDSLGMDPGIIDYLPIVPGSAGFGMHTVAGSGRHLSTPATTVIKVTNLNTSGAGSLKAAIDATGPRVVVFEVAGTIQLTGDLRISNPYITIAGQTAPSPGIAIRGGGLTVTAHDVLIQHLRVRVGDNLPGPSAGDRDALKINGTQEPNTTYNVVIDHCSFSWAVDETISLWNETGGVTVQNSIMSEALNNSIHPEGVHGFGPIFGYFESSKVTFVGNLLAHQAGRNPFSYAAELVMANNVVYNWQDRAATLAGLHEVVSKNTIVGNVFIRGANTGSNKPIWMWGTGSAPMVAGSKVYVADNAAVEFDGSDPWSVVYNGAGPDFVASTPPTWNNGLMVLPTAEDQVLNRVIADVGAHPLDRDPVDDRVVNDVVNGTGSIIDSQDDVGGWPVLNANARSLAIPPNKDQVQPSGYTVLEEWLHTFPADIEGALSESDQIVSVSTSTSKAAVAYEGFAQVGNGVYMDRTDPLYTFASIPSAYQGLDGISGFCDDKRAHSDSTYYTFTLASPGTLYVLWDDRAALASWLTSDFTDTGDDITIDSGVEMIIMSVWSKNIASAGQHTLNGMGGTAIQYTVLFKLGDGIPPSEEIIGVSTSTSKAAVAYEGFAQVGNGVYFDRTSPLFTFGAIPSAYQGLDGIRGFCDDKRAPSDSTYYTFTSASPGSLYVLWDDRAAPASWLMSDFTDTGDDITIDSGTETISMSVWSKNIASAGQHTLNGMGGTAIQYIVLFEPES
ncbi:hypothetical protein [Parapedobacter tibetensis]|uniref:hypothetical protein n=1 Tax=Parapedobacter tibetensis TaxID=2972951 RepID=UPI00214D3DC7|nr:hypothetical protein [Parapedobacter tibetensis]